MNRESLKRDIAIIGVSCKFPKSNNLKEFWNNLIEGNEMADFYTDEELIDLGVDQSFLQNPNFIKRKTALENASSFDYPFFGFTKDEANLMDPQIRFGLEQTWKALEDAGYNSYNYDKKIGAFLTAENNFNWIAHSMMTENSNVDNFYLSQIANKNALSTLISYTLDLKGPSLFVETGCSSSLVTTHLACRSLLLRECSMAITGGVNLNSAPSSAYIYQEGMINSKDGYCRPFDSQSSGTTSAEGGGIVVLKRLEDAINDRDNIYAVIRSSAINNDGSGKVGFTAPSVKGQVDCITAAHKMAKVPANTISYIECHGTGTNLGDPVEISALNQAFNNDKEHKCAIGTLKSNIGHLGNAAGIGGLIKAVLSLKYKMLPPLKNFEKPNPEIDFENGPFYVNKELTNWKRINDSTPLRAGVSSFGIGGTNAHVVLEEFQQETNEATFKPFQLMTYSAKSEKALNNYENKLSDFLVKEEFSLPDVSYTMNATKADFSFKDFIVGSSKEELYTNLVNKKRSQKRNKTKQVVFMFPGQGSQYFKMGKDLYESEPVFKKYMNQGFEILAGLTGEDYSKIMGYVKSDVNEKLIYETLHTQPALFLFEYALASLLLKWGIKPDNMIGHSLGEYVAACLAGVFSMEEALGLLVKRAQLMNKVERGGMVALDAPVEKIAELADDSISIASINSSTSCVVSGDFENIDKFVELMEAQDISYSKLKTSHAFHSQMMDVILEEYKNELEKVKLSKPQLSFISNLTGRPIKEEEATSTEYWVRHLRHAVNFRDGVDFLLQKEGTTLMEIGPGKTLISLARQSSGFSKKNTTVEFVRSYKEEINDNLKFTKALGNAWSSGVKIDWSAYYEKEERNRVSVPGYSFDQYELDLKVNPYEKIQQLGGQSSNLEDWTYIPNWKKSVLKKDTKNDSESFLVFSDESKLTKALVKKLKKENYQVLEVKRGNTSEVINENEVIIDPTDESAFSQLFSQLENSDLQINQIIFNWNFEGEDQETMLSAFETINFLCRSLTNYYPDNKKKITVLNKFGFDILGNEKTNVAMAASVKQFYVFSQENPNVFTCNVDVDQQNKISRLVSSVVNELKYNFYNRTVAFRGDNRWSQFYDEVDMEVSGNDNLITSDKVYLITGGMGEVGKELAAGLCDLNNCTVVLLGRRVLSDQPTNNEAQQKLMNDFNQLKEGNRNIYYYNADVADFDQFNQVINKIENTHGQISGVIHAAGNIAPSTFKPIEELNKEIALQQFSPKIQGTKNIYNVFKDKPLDFVWITSSLASILGGLSYGAYAVSNAFIDAFINSNATTLKNWSCINLDGVGENRISRRLLPEILVKSIHAEAYPQVIFSVNDPNLIRESNDNPTPEEESVSNDLVLERDLLDSEYTAPTTEVEAELCELLQSFFGYQKIGIDDDLFELGADSLKAMTLMKRMNKIYEVELTILDVFTNPTIRELSEKIEFATRVMNIQESAQGQNTVVI